MEKLSIDVKMSCKNPEQTDEHVLMFPLLNVVDNSELLPTYSAILQENDIKDEKVGVEDLDMLQLELEALLSAVVVRSHVLQKQIETVNKLKRNIKKTKSSHPVKRSRLERAVKQAHLTNLSSSSQLQFTKPPQLKFQKIEKPSISLQPTKNEHLSEIVENNMPCEEPIRRISIGKQMNVHKFWRSVDRYCRPVSQSDLIFLQNIIKAEEAIETCSPIPVCMNELWNTQVEHKNGFYPIMASHESLLVDTITPANSSLNFHKTKHSPRNISEMQHIPPTYKEVQNNIQKESTEPKSNFMKASIKIELDSEISEAQNLQMCVHNPSINSLNYNGLSLDNIIVSNVKQDPGLPIEMEELNLEPPVKEDELLIEMKRCHAQMVSIAIRNVMELKRCLKLSELQVKRQRLQKKLREYDSEILSIHQKINDFKFNKIPVNERDRKYAWELLKNREILVKQLDIYDA